MLVSCEQDSVVRRVVEDRAHCQVKIAMNHGGGSRFGGGRQRLTKGHQWVRRHSMTSTGVGLQGSEEQGPSTSSMSNCRLHLEMSPQGWRVQYQFRFRHLLPLHPVVRDRRHQESPWTQYLVI